MSLFCNIFNREQEILDEDEKELEKSTKWRLENLQFILELQSSLSEIKPIVKSPWEIKEEKRKQREKEILQEMANNSYFQNQHLKKELKKHGMGLNSKRRK